MDHSRNALFLIYMGFTILASASAARGYLPKWKKQACELSALQNENSHYTCNDNGDVKCSPGTCNRTPEIIYHFRAEFQKLKSKIDSKRLDGRCV